MIEKYRRLKTRSKSSTEKVLISLLLAHPLEMCNISLTLETKDGWKHEFVVIIIKVQVLLILKVDEIGWKNHYRYYYLDRLTTTSLSFSTIYAVLFGVTQHGRTWLSWSTTTIILRRSLRDVLVQCLQLRL